MEAEQNPGVHRREERNRGNWQQKPGRKEDRKQNMAEYKKLLEVSACTERMGLRLSPDTLQVRVFHGKEVWCTEKKEPPYFLYGERKILFSDAGSITHEIVKSGIGSGIRSAFRDFRDAPGTAFETFVWIEEAAEDVFFEWIPLEEVSGGIREVCWPPPLEFSCKSRSWYTLVNEGQGLLIPNDWEVPSRELHFHGMFLTAGSYMPWFGQIRERSSGEAAGDPDRNPAADSGEQTGTRAGYIAIALTPWNGRVVLSHPAGGPFTHVSAAWQPSLGRMDYRRILRFSFRENCDYNDLCKIYRNYVMENALACTLREKEVRIPSVRKLAGAAFVHTGIKTHVDPASDFYDPEHPEKNNTLTTFEERREQICRLHRLGVKKLYLHLDGWAQPGYDNRHPDYFPACREAGGYAGLRDLVNCVQELGWLIGLHDQYRDYYKNAPSYSREYSCINPDGSVPSHARWAGGPQDYLCAALAPYYVRRNFQLLFENGIHPDGSYLDVFTCNEGDECASPRHRMTRRDCLEFRGKCFQYLISRGILPSSEEVSDWSMRDLVFCHYAPYSFQLLPPGTPRTGLPVPLFNLVYHDCVIIPWMMEKMSGTEDYMLYALLNGGAPYLIRDGAYPDTDGAYAPEKTFTPEEMLERCSTVCALHERVAYEEMLSHEFVDGNPMIQRSVFADGTCVTVDFAAGTYTIGMPLQAFSLCSKMKKRRQQVDQDRSDRSRPDGVGS